MRQWYAMELLDHQTVLIVDCQATGANPDCGALLEIGWKPFRADALPHVLPDEVHTILVKPPGAVKIPPRIEALTGITDSDFDPAFTDTEAWERLKESFETMAQGINHRPHRAVIHFSRFEMPFLRHIHKKVSPHGDFPFEVVCTHEIAKRIFPQLPRLGLRALAGYLGYAVPEKRRCKDHVAATAFVWHHLVKKLRRESGIRTFEELDRWLVSSKGNVRRGRSFPMADQCRKDVPDQPGVYRMLRRHGDTLYVGKAVSLKKRVNSYFHRNRSQSDHILEMLSQATDVAVTVTDTAFEAALMETDEIKRLNPPYNVALRKGQRKPGFSNKSFSSLSHAPDQIHCVGPFPSVSSMEPFTVMVGAMSKWNDLSGAKGLLPAAILGVQEHMAPEYNCFFEGLRIFRRRHVDLLDGRSARTALVRLGTRLFRQKLIDQVLAAASDAGEKSEVSLDIPDDDPSEEFQWTPEKVADALDSVVRRSVQWIRRGRWFRLLSESSITWQRRNKDSGRHRIIVIKHGRVRTRYDGSFKAQEGPQRDDRGVGSPLNIFDVATFDRMRVATTEIRRIVNNRRHIEVRIGPSACLCRDKLAKLLIWI